MVQSGRYNANSVVRSSFMLVGVGCEGKLRFVTKGIVCFICVSRLAIFLFFSGQIINQRD